MRFISYFICLELIMLHFQVFIGEHGFALDDFNTFKLNDMI